jgi:hypothetical protein
MLANAPRYINSIEDFGNSAVIIQKNLCTVLDTHEMVGCASHMATCRLLAVCQVYSDGSYYTGSSSNGPIWRICVDID